MAAHETIEKQYYSIGEVSKILGVNASLLRFWETEFEQLTPRKNKKGNRIFTKDDLELQTFSLKVWRTVLPSGITKPTAHP